jgi:hypothetical protein
MQRHEIPTHLEVEDKLLGPLTARDALALLVGASAAYGLWSSTWLPSWTRSTLAGVVSVVALAFALVKIEGRPLEGWLFAGLTYAGSARRVRWARRSARSTRVQTASTARVRHYRLRVRWRLPRPARRDGTTG